MCQRIKYSHLEKKKERADFRHTLPTFLLCIGSTKSSERGKEIKPVICRIMTGQTPSSAYVSRCEKHLTSQVY